MNAINAALAAGTLVRVRKGIYLPGELARSLSRWDKDLVALHAHARAARNPPVFVGASAARLWNLDVWPADRSIHLLERGTNRSNTHGPPVTCHDLTMRSGELTALRGLRVTTLERTVVDCIRTFEIASGVILADSALRRGVSKEALGAALGDSTGTRGTVRAAQVLALADGRSESVAEGRLRVLMHVWGLPAPVLQYEAATARHRYRLDMAWPDIGRAVEVHGNGKYFQYMETSEKLLRERKREAELAETGITVLNVWWEQLRRPDLRTRLLRHLAPLLEQPG